MKLTTTTPIDLQLHTIHSDGTWQPEALLDHLIQAGFGAAAITDHDRVDTIASLQALAQAKGFLLLAAVEMSAQWRNEPVDMLCYGIDPTHPAINALADGLLAQQQANIRQTVQAIAQQGYTLPEDAVQSILAQPAVQQPHSLVRLVKEQGYSTPTRSAGKLLVEAGLELIMVTLEATVEAVHDSGGVCLIGHPGRGDGYINFDATLLDELRSEIPIDGLEVYYPAHSPAQISLYQTYAAQHHLLISAGSDSHTPDKPPIPYPADLCQALLARLGITLH